MSFPDPRNRKAFEWHVDHALPVTGPDIARELLHWLKWLHDEERFQRARRTGLGSITLQRTIRWGGLTVSVLSLLALRATAIGAPVAIFGAALTILNEINIAFEDSRAARLRAAITRVSDRVAVLEGLLHMPQSQRTGGRRV